MNPMPMTPNPNGNEARTPAIAATFERYVKSFELPENAVLAAFRKLVHEDHHLLEYSIKIDEDGVHPARFAMIYDGEAGLKLIGWRLDGVVPAVVPGATPPATSKSP